MDSFRCGHPRSTENSAPNGSAGFICRTCRNARKRKDYAADVGTARELGKLRTRKHRGGLRGNANRRKDCCPEGHEYTPENTYVTPEGVRQCKKCRRVHRAVSYERHRAVRTAEMRARRAANPEAVAEANRKWRRENPERAALTSRLKKQRRRAAGVLTIADWQGVLALYGSDCLSCGSDDPPTIDHVVPIIQGGSNTVDNVQPLCRTCNTRKGRKTIDYRPQLVAAV